MRLEIQCEDRVGMIREILDIFIPHHIDVRMVEVDSKQRCVYCGFSDVPFSLLQSLLAEIRKLDSVEDVKTVRFTPFEREHNALYTLLETLPDGVIAVDLQGKITMVTELAAKDLNVPVPQLLHQPLQDFIKGIHFSKSAWAKPQAGSSKRIRLQNNTFLLEMRPFFVVNDEGDEIPAGSVVYLKSEQRLDRQTANLKLAPEAENPLEGFFQADLIKSHAMARTLQQAKVFALTRHPLLVQGESGTGKRHLIEALFQYWQRQEMDHTVELVVRHASDISLADIQSLDQFTGWFVIDQIEHLTTEVQQQLVLWLQKQADEATSFDRPVRLVSVTQHKQAGLVTNGMSNELYFQLAKLSLAIPALRDRTEDLPGLIRQTLTDLTTRYRKPVPILSKSAQVKLSMHAWAGNLAELQNVCLQTLLACPTSHWQAEDIHLEEASSLSLRLENDSLEQTVKMWEAQLLRQLYPQYPSTRRLAKAVGMSHSTIANKLKEYGIHN
ncbi:TyrR/PhhR family helix-turn-helix DNA-binding protein [Marinomonas sp. THO17]|uniref:TyrR/PhhR family helix-turn-helix DNA-binding protein n=1 Tax=Marinomonas sp. THO17 TaxID=3149048 RepID=UPI00336BCCDF